MNKIFKVHAIYNGAYTQEVIDEEYLEHSAIWRDYDMVAIEEEDGKIHIKKNRDGDVGTHTKEKFEEVVRKCLNVCDVITK